MVVDKYRMYYFKSQCQKLLGNVAQLDKSEVKPVTVENIDFLLDEIKVEWNKMRNEVLVRV